MKFELPRGMRDFDIDDYRYLNLIRKEFYDVAKIFNYKSTEPSTIELLSTLEAKSGPSIINEVYEFQDKGNRNVSLRYDLTVGLTRYATSRRDLKIPIKLSSFGGVWRYDEPQAGRYRYFHQWDIELYDNFSLESDADIIEFVSVFLKKIGLNDYVTINISDRRILEEFISKKKIPSNKSNPQDTIDEYFRAIDKIPKKGIAKVCDEYKNKLDENILKESEEIFSLSGNAKDIFSNNKLNNLTSFESLKKLINSLESRNISNVSINLGIVRGLDYYSGMVFEVFDTLNPSLGSLIGGGRYDKLPSIFGRGDLGAVGAAGGVERIMLSMKNHNLLPESDRKLIYVVCTSPNLKKHVVKIVSQLRSNDIPTDYDIGNKPFKKQLNEASKYSLITVIIAEKEINQNQVIIKDMKTGEESLILAGELSKKILSYTN
ncbi:MAG: histidine--tRNA ligase [Nitrososphaeraceae archaeon]